MVRTVTESPFSTLLPEFDIGQQNWDAPHHLAIGQLQMHHLFKTVALEPSTAPAPLPVSSKPLDLYSMAFADPLRAGLMLDGEQFLNRRLFNDALMVLHRGEVVHESYRNGMQAQDRHVIHSCTKSLCSMLVAMAIDEGKFSRAQPFSDYVPELATLDAWQGVSLQQVLDMQTGIEYSEDYTDPDAHYWHYARAAGYYPPLPGEEAIGVRNWVLQNLNVRVQQPGSCFSYNSCLTNLLGIALENAYQLPLAQLFEENLYQRVGPASEAYFNTDAFGFPITEGQLNLQLPDFARLALLLANDGRNLAGEQIVPQGFCEQLLVPDIRSQNAYQAGTPDPVFPTGQYRDQFWVVNPEQRQFTMLGIHGQFAWYDLQRELLVVGLGSYPQQDGVLMMTVLKTLWQTIAEQYG
jgi:CubicO group peptidase (beta-lactamase class C family)